MKKKENIALSELMILLPYYLLFDGLLLIIIALVCLCTGKIDFTLFTGFLVGNILSVGNFLLMGSTIQQTLYKQKKKAMLHMNVSYVIRYLGMFAILGVLLYTRAINIFPAFIPLLFPKFAYTLDYIFRKTEE